MAKKAQNSKRKTKNSKKEVHIATFSPKMMGLLADEVAKTVIRRLLSFRRRTKRKKNKKIENAIFLDTSAIIDGRIFEIINLGLFTGTFVVLESILLELKHIADSQDTVKRERGRQGIGYLDDGTMIVVENAVEEIGKETDVLVSRVIQTAAGRILFAKKI